MSETSRIGHARAFSLEGELALITGGATGLGFAMARAFTDAGARVILAGRRRTELERAASELGPAAGFAVHDVTNCAAAPALAADLENRFGPVTILVNNAGTHMKKTAEDLEEEEFRGVMDTHVTGAWAMVKAFVPAMKRLGHGNILFTASMGTFFGIPKVFAYITAKAAHAGMVRSLAVDLSQHGIRVNAVAPGWIETDLSRYALAGDPERRERILKRTPMGRLGTLEDVGWAAVYLCSPAARYVNGVILPVDGGMLAGF
jgi:gluconate 5-dehydrogenase